MRKSYFVRLLFSTLLMIALLVGGTHVVIQYFLLSDVKTELEAQDEEMLLLVQQQMDSQLSALKTLSQSIGLNSLFAKYKFMEDPYRTIEAIATLKSFVVANPIIETIGICYYNDDFMITNESSYRKYRFADYYHLPVDIFFGSPSSDSGFFKTEESLVFTFPLPLTGTPHGFSLFALDRDKLRKLILPPSSHLKNRGLLIMHANGEEVISNLRTDEESIESIGSGNFLITEFTSPQTGLNYLAVTPPEHYETIVSRFSRKIMVFMVFLTLLGLSVAYLVTNFNYAPIKAMVKSLKLPDNPQNKPGSELEEIEHILANLLPYTEHPEKLIETEMQNRRNALSDLMLKGQCRDPYELKERCEQAGWLLPYQYYGVIISRFHRTVPEDTSFSTYREAGFICHPIIRQDLTGQIIFILNLEEWNENAEHFENLKMHLESKGKSSATLGISGVVEDPSLLSRCYLEASTAIDYRLVKGINRVIPYTSIPNPDQEGELRDTTTILQQIKQDLQDNKISHLQQSIGVILKQCNQLSLSAARYVFWELIHIVREFALSLTGTADLTEKLIPDIRLLTQYESFEELSRFISQWFTGIQKCFLESNNGHKNLISRQIKYYIRQNYARYDLSLQTLAEYFQLSQGYLCRVFKEEENSTILSFISRERLQAACRLLVESEFPVKEIVAMIGFSDSASFIRKFRKAYGVSPGRYRILHSGAA